MCRPCSTARGSTPRDSSPWPAVRWLPPARWVRATAWSRRSRPRNSPSSATLNAIAAIKALIGDLDKVERVVKVVGFVASDPAFTGQPGVINGASELFGKAFGDRGIHARSAVGVAALPLDAPVEVEVIVHVAD